MDKVLSEVIEELGNSRLSAKEMFDKYMKYKTLSNIVVQNYNRIKTTIPENTKRGYIQVFQSDICGEGQQYGQLREIVLDLLKEDGFHVEIIQILFGTGYSSPGYLIAWDERIPAVKYAVDGPEYQKMKALIENLPSTNGITNISCGRTEVVTFSSS
jgi:hypothetical protein